MRLSVWTTCIAHCRATRAPSLGTETAPGVVKHGTVQLAGASCLLASDPGLLLVQTASQRVCTTDGRPVIASFHRGTID